MHCTNNSIKNVCDCAANNTVTFSFSSLSFHNYSFFSGVPNIIHKHREAAHFFFRFRWVLCIRDCDGLKASYCSCEICEIWPIRVLSILKMIKLLEKRGSSKTHTSKVVSTHFKISFEPIINRREQIISPNLRLKVWRIFFFFWKSVQINGIGYSTTSGLKINVFISNRSKINGYIFKQYVFPGQRYISSSWNSHSIVCLCILVLLLSGSPGPFIVESLHHYKGHYRGFVLHCTHAHSHIMSSQKSAIKKEYSF